MVHIKDDVTHRSHENHNVIMQKIYQNADRPHRNQRCGVALAKKKPVRENL